MRRHQGGRVLYYCPYCVNFHCKSTNKYCIYRFIITFVVEYNHMDRLSIIKYPIAKELELFKSLFDSSLTSSNILLSEVTAHLRKRDGKMMRPVLTLLTAGLFGEITNETLHGAVALELLHTASLVHDDVVDESDQRRGQLSVNAIFNNKVAVLSGDYILATCLVQAGKTMNPGIIDTISLLGQDLSAGELLQLSNIKSQHFSEEVYFDVIRKKTAALFSACTKVGALSVNATPDEVEWARLFGEYLGISFQIKDDVFDYFDSKQIGKPTGNDMLEGKLTLPVIHALNATGDEWARGVALKVRENRASFHEIDELVTFTKVHGGIEYAIEQMHEYQHRALNLLNQKPDSEIKNSLKLFAEHVVDRKK